MDTYPTRPTVRLQALAAAAVLLIAAAGCADTDEVDSTGTAADPAAQQAPESDWPTVDAYGEDLLAANDDVIAALDLSTRAGEEYAAGVINLASFANVQDAAEARCRTALDRVDGTPPERFVDAHDLWVDGVGLLADGMAVAAESARANNIAGMGDAADLTAEGSQLVLQAAEALPLDAEEDPR